MIVAVQPPETSREPEAAQELALVKRTVAGEEAALRALYDRHADPLFAYISHSLGGNRLEAEEIWQESLTAALRALPTFEGNCRFFSWLCGIARHKLADHLRRRRRHEGHLCHVPPEDLARLLDAGPLPDELAQRRDVRLRVLEALQAVPEEYRAALVARYAEGRPVAEVAVLLGKSYKAAESVLSRARECFREQLIGKEEVGL